MEHSEKSGEATTIAVQEPKIAVQEPKANPKGKGIVDGAPATVTVSTKATTYRQAGWGKGLAIFDFVVRLCAITAGLAATGIMGTAQQTLPFFTQFFQFQAQYNDLPTLMFFVVAMGIVSGYLILSLPFSIVCIVRPRATGIKLLLIIFDTIFMALAIASASAAADTIYLAHNGNSSANWNAICQQFTDFCQQSSSAAVAAFITAVLLIVLILLSAFALRRN